MSRPAVAIALILAAAFAPASSVRAAEALDALTAEAGEAPAEAPVAEAPAPATAETRSPAEQAAFSVWWTMLSGMDKGRSDLLIRTVRISIVPRDVKLVDAVAAEIRRQLPTDAAAEREAQIRESYSRRLMEEGQRTPAEPRGVTLGLDTPEGPRMFVFVGEENLTADGDWDENGSRTRRILVHELGHATMNVTATGAERDVAARGAAAYWKDAREGDDGEIFAISTEIWFGRHQRGLRVAGDTAEDAGPKLAEMMRLMAYVYGPARDVR